MTLQVGSFVAGSSFCKANKKLQHKLGKTGSERNLFKKEEKNTDKAGNGPAGISWLMFFTVPSMLQLEKDRGQRIEEMNFRDDEPFTFTLYGREHHISLKHLKSLISSNRRQYLQIEGHIDRDGLKRMLCLIRDGTGRLDAAKQAMAEK